MCVCVCAFHSRTPTSLCRHGFVLSSHTMIFLFFSARLFLPSLSLPLSLPRSPPSLSLSLSLMQLWALSEAFLHLLSDSLRLSEAEPLSSPGLSPLSLLHHGCCQRCLFLPSFAPHTHHSCSFLPVAHLHLSARPCRLFFFPLSPLSGSDMKAVVSWRMRAEPQVCSLLSVGGGGFTPPRSSTGPERRL